MKFFNKTAQFLGEGVGMFEKTEESEAFKLKEEFYHETKDTTHKVVTSLRPASTKGIGKEFQHFFKKEVALVTEESKDGAAFVDLAQKLKAKAPNQQSPFADGVYSLGESLLEIGNLHAAHDKNLIENSIGPLDNFTEGKIKPLQALEKDYDGKRLEYDASRRVYKKKPTPENKTEMEQAKQNYEAGKTAYLNAIDGLQISEREMVGSLKQYCADQAAYYQRLAQMYGQATKKLEKVHSDAASFKPSSSGNQQAYTPTNTTESVQQPMSGQSGRYCTAIYDFAAQNPQELSLRSGDVVTITRDVNQDWWEGEINGKRGLFPKNYVRLS